MRKLISIFAAAVLWGALIAPLHATVDRTIIVKNQFGEVLPGATVYAVVMDKDGPDAAKTTFTYTSAQGSATLTLQDNEDYHFFAVKQHYLPRLKSQVHNPEHPMARSQGSLADLTIVISSAEVSSGDLEVGRVLGNVTNATANSLVFGSLMKAKLDNSDNVEAEFEVDYAMCRTDNGGDCDLYVLNVPTTTATNVYRLGAFDPQDTTGGECFPQQITSAIAPDATVNVAMDFDTCGMSVRKGDIEVGGGVGGLSAEGVIVDTATNNPLPFMEIGFNTQDNSNEHVWTRADENGRFQFYGLTEGTTYFANLYGAGSCAMGAGIYQSHNSTGSTTNLGVYDFLYDGTRRLLRVGMEAYDLPTATLTVHVRDNTGTVGVRSWVSLGGDWNQWETTGNCGGSQVRDGGQNWCHAPASTGSVTFYNMPTGNYSVEVWTEFNNQGIRYNAGPDGEDNSGNCGSDDLRILVSTNAAQFGVYDSSGDPVSVPISSVTVLLNTQQNNSGLIYGTLDFPNETAVDLLDDPITLMARGRCDRDGCQPGAFEVVAGSGTNSYNYQLNVASGSSYELRVLSGFWARLGEGHGFHDITLESTDTVRINMSFARGGQLKGRLLKPDGTTFKPQETSGNYSGAWVNAEGECGYGGNEVNSQGEFTIEGLLPCEFELNVHGWGNFPYANAEPRPAVTILKDQVVSADLQMAHGIAVDVALTTTSLPWINYTLISEGGGGFWAPLNTWVAQAFPAGVVFTQKNLLEILDSEGGFRETRFEFHPDATKSPCNIDAICPRALANGNYDFYLMQKGEFRPEGQGTGKPFMYFTIFSSSKNIEISSNKVNTSTRIHNGPEVPAVGLDLTPLVDYSGRGSTILRGSATASNIFREGDFNDLGGSFDNFMKFIPAVAIYNSSGALIAGGLITPCAECITQQENTDLDKSIASGDWTVFDGVFDAWASRGAYAYEIRGLPPGETVTAVYTTPNYPPIKKSITLLADGTTKYVDVDFDTEAGTGASFSGVVRDSSTVAIQGAIVKIEAEAYGDRTKKTDSGGNFAFPGLPNGTYRVTVQAPGYVPAAAKLEVSQATSYSLNFGLQVGGGSVEGTVYKERFPFPRFASGAEVLCYDDTYNGNNPTAELPLYKVRTSSAGYYRLENLVPGDVYRCSVKLTGRYILTQTTTAIAGAITDFDFFPTPKPPRIEVGCRADVGAQKVECLVENPSDFDDGWAWHYTSSDTFNENQATRLQESQFTELSDGKILITMPFSDFYDNVVYKLRVQAITQSTKKIVTREVEFSKDHTEGSSENDIDEQLLGDSSADTTGRKKNEVCMDVSGQNASCMTIPVGSMLPVSSGAIPSLSFGSLDLNASTVAALVNAISSAAFVSDIYRLDVSSVNFTDRGVDVCLAYSQTDSDLADVGVHRFNDSTNEWELIEGQQTISAVKGTVCVRIGNLSGAAVQSLEARSSPMRATFNGRTHAVRPLASGSGGSGSFAILKPSLTTGNAYAGDSFKVYNFPNPFNLDNKTVSIVNGGATNSVATSGTVIKLEVPSTVDANQDAWVRIYNLAGELVDELHLGQISGGKYYYATWDGRNGSGQAVANGVYYGIVVVPGVKAKNATFKMAVIK